MHRIGYLGLAAAALLGLSLTQAAVAVGGSRRPVAQAPRAVAKEASATPPQTRWHFAPNDNFDGAGRYLPGVDGFNLADVSSVQELSRLPASDQALVFIGTCNGADPAFAARLRPFVGVPRIFGFYLMDDPDPAACPAANLRSESDWVHARFAGAVTFVVLMNLSSPSDPSYDSGYAPGHTGIDLFGLDAYPCRSERAGCDDSIIVSAVAAAIRAGVPVRDIVPMYQAFGGGQWPDGGGGHFLLPSAGEEERILTTWGSQTPTPVFDYAYSWGSQRGDAALSGAPDLEQLFSARG